MTTALKTTSRIAAVVAGFALVASALAPMAHAQSSASLAAQIAALQAQIATLKAQLGQASGKSSNSCSVANRDLRVGSSGPEVTELQNFLIGKGFSIRAGATGYFGGQTQAALARYQASVGIRPAAGYFGPMTRAQVAANCTPTTPPQDTDDEDDDEDEDENEDTDRDTAEAAIADARDALADAHDELDELADDGEDIDDAEDLLDEAEALLDEADEAFDDEDYEAVEELVDEADDLIDEALDEAGVEEEDEDNDNEVETSARVTTQSGADNDYGTFEIEMTIEAIGDDAYISRTASTAFTYQIEDASDGGIVSSATSQTAVISSSADTEGSSYRVEEGEREEFTFTVTFDPLPADEGESYRLQLLTVVSGDDEGDNNEIWTARPAPRYETDAIYIND